VWHLTQAPDLHARWDLRFTAIEYLPRPDAGAPQRFLYRTRIGFGREVCGEGESVAFPMLFSGVADVREWYDDARGKFGIEVRVANRTWGPLFGYRGWFDAEWRPVASGVPADVRPRREEPRE
jgi:hypothetical protein